jgi:hypothetical protein
MPTLAIPVRARFIIDFLLDNERGDPATPMSATIEREPTNLAPTAPAVLSKRSAPAFAEWLAGLA